MKNSLKNTTKKIRYRLKKTLKNRTLRIVFWTILTQYTLTLLLRRSSLNRSRGPLSRPRTSAPLSWFCGDGNFLICWASYPVQWASQSLFGWLWPFGKKNEEEEKKKKKKNEEEKKKKKWYNLYLF